MRCFGRFVWSLLLASASLAPARAVSAQQQVEDAWKIGVELGLNAARGNTHLTLFSTALEVTRLETAGYELSWNAKMLYGEDADSVLARRFATGLNFDWHPEDRISPFIFVAAERDRFRKLDVRTNAGAGVKYLLWRAERTSGSLSAAVLHDYQNFSASPTDVDNSTSAARWSIRAKADAELENGLTLQHVTFFKPVFDDIEDFDIETTSKAALKMSERLAVMLSWVLRYDATPPPDVRKDDQVLQIGLSFDL